MKKKMCWNGYDYIIVHDVIDSSNSLEAIEMHSEFFAVTKIKD